MFATSHIPQSKRAPRRRWILVVCLLGVIVWGLASREYPFLFPVAWGKYPGDALWALMIYLGWCLLFPKISVNLTGGLALGISFLIEFSQLYQAPWINTLRATTFGHLVLGQVFLWQYLVAYSIGVALAMLGDFAIGKLMVQRTNDLLT